MKTNKLKIFSFTAGIVLLFASCGEEEKKISANLDNSISSVVERTDSSLDSLHKALVQTDLLSTFQSGSYTVFAPNNDAFISLLGNLGYESINEIPVNTLADILKYHVVTGDVKSGDLTNDQVVQTLLTGESLTFSVFPDSPIIISGALSSGSITYADWQCSNGVIHVIDTVLLPN